MNLMSCLIPSILIAFIVFVMAFGTISQIYKTAYNAGFNEAIDAIPTGVIFNHKLDVYGLKLNELPWYADNKPFIPLGKLSLKFVRNDEYFGDTLTFREILPRKK